MSDPIEDVEKFLPNIPGKSVGTHGYKKDATPKYSSSPQREIFYYPKRYINYDIKIKIKKFLQ